MPRVRCAVLITGALAVLIGVEVGFQTWKPATARVKIVNGGDDPIHNLVLTRGADQTTVPEIGPRQSETVSITASRPVLLNLRFDQFNNAIGGFQVEEVSTERLRRDGNLLVLEIKNNEFARYQEPDETPTPTWRLARNLRSWLGLTSLESP